MFKQALTLGLLSISITGTVSAEDNPAITERVKAAKTVTADFVGQLSSAMIQEMKAGGPTAAITVCRDLGPEIANQRSLETGWKVTRVGTRVRNPLLGTPDAWEQKTLQQFADRAAKGESYDTMAFYEVVEEPNGKYLRFAKAVGVAGKCLVCHGEPENMPGDLRQLIEQHYPHDQAIHYSAGDLRGAISIKQPLEN